MAVNTDTKTEKVIYVEGKPIEYTDERNLLEVIRKAGIDVPTFCYRDDLSVYGACRMCVVEVENRGVQASCTMPPEPGLKVKVNTEKTRRIRKMSLELLLANHDRECTICERNSNCELQALANKLGVKEIRFGKKEDIMPIDDSNPSVVRNPNKCILCGACVRTCKEIQGQNVLDFAGRGSKTTVGPAYNKTLDEVDCVYCGQCISTCPTGALAIKSDLEKAWDSILKEDQMVVVQVAPAVRVAVGEAFGFEPGENTMSLITAALKRIGFDKVFDTSFAADVTIMEEATEFISRFKKKENLPIYTSCCPAWVRFAEYKHPSLLTKLSTCRSPQQMFGSIAKKYISKEDKINPENITVVSIMPCTAKKAESIRDEFKVDGNYDVDIVLTTQELIKMIKESGVDFKNLKPEPLDQPFGVLTGAGVIFGSSGGVTEAAIRTAYEMVTGKTLQDIAIKEARGHEGLKEFTVSLDGHDVKVAIVSSLSQADSLVKKIENGELHYDIVEVMACPGGCVSGAGQPTSVQDQSIKEKRADGLYKADVMSSLHKSHENPQVKNLYEKWLESPNSKVAHEVLHTHYKNRKRISSHNIELTMTDSDQKKVDVKVCVGTCCYLKGSYDFMEELLGVIKDSDAEEKVSVNATFCFESCGKSPCISVNDELVTEATKDKARDIFSKHISDKLQQ